MVAGAGSLDSLCAHMDGIRSGPYYSSSRSQPTEDAIVAWQKKPLLDNLFADGSRSVNYYTVGMLELEASTNQPVHTYPARFNGKQDQLDYVVDSVVDSWRVVQRLKCNLSHRTTNLSVFRFSLSPRTNSK